jgi:hypothetical protein
MTPPKPKPPADKPKPRPAAPPELYQIIVECTGEAQQRDLFDRLQREGLKLRLLVL